MVDGNPQAVIANVPGPAVSLTLDGEASRQPFCGDREGWGPISSVIYDFTPCFLDVWVAAVAAWGIFFGAGAIWFLLTKRVAQPVSKNWHFWAKLVSLLSHCLTG